MKYCRIGLLTGALVCQLISNRIKAQDAAEVENVFKVNVLTPGLSYETRIGKKQTLYTEAYLALFFAFSYSSNFGSNADFRTFPSLDLAYRFYYNGSRRAGRGLTTSMNSMNYFTFVYTPTFYKEQISINSETEKKIRVQHTMGIAWGVQRNYNNCISLDAFIGPGCSISTSSGTNISGQLYSNVNIEPTLVFKTRFGFWINKRKNN